MAKFLLKNQVVKVHRCGSLVSINPSSLPKQAHTYSDDELDEKSEMLSGFSIPYAKNAIITYIKRFLISYY